MNKNGTKFDKSQHQLGNNDLWKTLERRKNMAKDEIIKKINIEQLDRKTLNKLINMIYVIDKNNTKIEFKNI